MESGHRKHLVVIVNVSRLARECAARGWSYRELAYRAHVSRPTIASAVSGRGVRPSTYRRIVAALAAAPAPDSFDIVEDIA
jgi:transcriptional regulator with XRE-family HTH domain